MKYIGIVLAVVLAACGGQPRHVMTDADQDAIAKAKITGEKPTGDRTWTDTEQNQHELTCIQDLGPPFYSCIAWQRNAPTGAFDCGGDLTAYSGEFLFSDMANFNATNCAGYNHGSRPQGLSALGDYNDVVRAIKNNTGVEIHGYRDPNFGQNVQFFPTNGQTITNLSSPYNNQMSSFRN